jgi:N-acetylglucosamine kinase-like BadF-type ATPase
VRFVLGIDAGGTKTVGLLADESGRVMAEARGGGANLQIHGELEVEKVFDRVIEKLTGGRPVASLCLGIAGVDRARDEVVIRDILRRLGHRETARVVNDAVIALVAGAPERVGIVVLAGTGSIAYGVDAGGRHARSGGLGSLLADEGSGYWLGHQALRAAVRAADGRGPATRLQGLLFDALGIASVQEIVPMIYEQGLSRQRIAAFAILVQKARDDGDALAAELTQTAARELAMAVRAVASRLDLGGSSYPVVLAGGAFKACPCLSALLKACLGLERAELRPLAVEPAQGAVALALEQLE